MRSPHKQICAHLKEKDVRIYEPKRYVEPAYMNKKDVRHTSVTKRRAHIWTKKICGAHTSEPKRYAEPAHLNQTDMQSPHRWIKKKCGAYLNNKDMRSPHIFFVQICGGTKRNAGTKNEWMNRNNNCTYFIICLRHVREHCCSGGYHRACHQRHQHLFSIRKAWHYPLHFSKDLFRGWVTWLAGNNHGQDLRIVFIELVDVLVRHNANPAILE